MKKLIGFFLLMASLWLYARGGTTWASYAILPLVPIIGAAAGLLGQGINAASQSAANKASMKFQIGMYNRQRKDALDDWNRQNEYNSPLAQMTRFKDAGLNPNLIYGQSNQAPAVRSSSGGDKPNIVAPQFDLGGIIGEFVRIKLQEEQIGNLEKMQDLKDKQMQAMDLGMKLSNQKYYQNEMMFPTSLEMQRERVRTQEMQTVTGWNRDNREWTKSMLDQNMNAVEIRRAEAQIGEIAQRIKASNQSIAESESRVKKILADIDRIAVLNDLTDDQRQNVQNAARVGALTGDFKEMQNDLFRNGLTKPPQQQILDWIKSLNPFQGGRGSAPKTPTMRPFEKPWTKPYQYK